MRIGIFTADSNGCYSVPSAKGGAVSSLIEHLTDRNNKEQLFEMHITTYWDKQSFELSRKYGNIFFHWIKTPSFIKCLDTITFYLISHYSSRKAISFKSVFSLIWYIIKSRRILKKGGFDYVVLENNIPLAWLIKLCGYKGKYIYHFHNIPRFDAKCRKVFDDCFQYLCVSDFVGKVISSEDSAIGKIPPNKIRTLYNCIDTDLFKPLPTMNKVAWAIRFGIPQNAKIVLFVGRLSEEKGVDKLLKAIDYVKTPRIYYLIVGNILHGANVKDEYTRHLSDLAEKHKDIVRFTGFIDSKQTPYLYNLANVSVLPSMWEEPAGLTMIESLACGTPVITTRSGGIPEYVGDAGIVLDRSEHIHLDIAKWIDKLFGDHKLYEDLSQKGIRRINEKFSKEGYLDNLYKEIYQ